MTFFIKPVSKAYWLSIYGVLLALYCFRAHSQNSAPPLLPPSAAQIKRGHELLDAIQKTIKYVPMTDSIPVLASLGLKNVIESLPNSLKGVVLKPQDLKQSGYLFVGHAPEVLGFASRERARLNLNMDTRVACISFEMVKATFGESYRSTEEPHVRFGNAPTPQPVIPHYGISYINVPFLNGSVGGVYVEFEFQTCASYLGIYTLKEIAI